MLLELDAKRFEGMIMTQPEISVRIIKKLAHRLEEADALIAILTKRDPKTRAILGLMREAERRGLPGSDPEALVIHPELDRLVALFSRGNHRAVRDGVDALLNALADMVSRAPAPTVPWM